MPALAVLLAACSSGATPGSDGSGPASSAPTAASSPPASSRAAPPPARDWPAYHGDARRSGVADMPAAAGDPVVLARVDAGAAVYASPLVLDGTVVVATEADVVLGLGTDGSTRWRTELGTPASRSELPCGNIDPLGITGTPAYDAGTGLVYLVAEHGGPPRHELVALDPRDGSVAWRRDVDLPGVDRTAMQQRGALAVAAGRVWVPFGGLAGDCGDYKGRLVGAPLSGTGELVEYTVPTRREAGIWTPPGAVVDGRGHLLVAVGNGASGPGDPYDHSDSVLDIDPSGAGGPVLADSFSPATWAADNAADLDLGSQGPALVGDRWVFAAGKSGTAYVLRQGDLGGIGGEVSQAQVCASFGGTAVDGDVVYVPCTDGVTAVRIGADGGMSVLWRADGSVTGSPVVGGGVVWSLDPGGTLHALDPATGESRSATDVGAASRFATPAASGPLLVVPTLAGVTFVRTS